MNAKIKIYAFYLTLLENRVQVSDVKENNSC